MTMQLFRALFMEYPTYQSFGGQRGRVVLLGEVGRHLGQLES